MNWMKINGGLSHLLRSTYNVCGLGRRWKVKRWGVEGEGLRRLKFDFPPVGVVTGPRRVGPARSDIRKSLFSVPCGRCCHRLAKRSKSKCKQKHPLVEGVFVWLSWILLRCLRMVIHHLRQLEHRHLVFFKKNFQFGIGIDHTLVGLILQAVVADILP